MTHAGKRGFKMKRENPMIVLKNQADLEERMDPLFWGPEFIEAENALKKYGYITIQELIQKGGSLEASDHIRNGRGEFLGEPPECNAQYFTVAGLTPTGYDTTKILFCSDNAYRRLERTKVKHGDILIADSGVSGIGRLCFIQFSPSELSCTGHLFVLRISQIDPRFLTVFLRTRFGQLQIHRRKHGVGSPYIKSEDIEMIAVPLFSKELQSAIASQHQVIEEMHESALIMKHRIGNREESLDQAMVSQYESILRDAEKLLNDLIQQLEEIILGKRMDIEPVDRILGK